MSNHLLIIEDEALLAKEMERRFQKAGWRVTLARDIASARHLLVDRQLRPLVVLADMNLPDGNSLDLLEELQPHRATIGEWILLTAFGGIPDSVRALRLGAHDFLEKPVDDTRIDLAMQRAARSARAHRRLSTEAAAKAAQFGVERFIGSSALASDTRHMLSQIARADFSALVLRGETGSGKGLAARILHYNGNRADGPLVEVNCAALPGELLESELFGHEAGAFTGAKGRREGLFERAHCGTLFLDEIGEMDLGLQAKLLKAVEDRRIRRVGGNDEIQIDVQIIAATNRDLEQEVAEGRFRSDLFHRLSVFQVVLPNLGDRREDIEELVITFVSEFNERTNRRIENVPDEVWRKLKAHHWPGNIRELRNVIERGVLLSAGEQLEARWLQLPTADPGDNMSSRAPATVSGEQVSFAIDGTVSLDDMERRIIEAALQKEHGNVTRAAGRLGVSRQTMRYRIDKHGIKPDALLAAS